MTNLSNKTWERGRHVIQNIQVRYMIRYYYTRPFRLFRLRFVFLVIMKQTEKIKQMPKENISTAKV